MPEHCTVQKTLSASGKYVTFSREMCLTFQAMLGTVFSCVPKLPFVHILIMALTMFLCSLLYFP